MGAHIITSQLHLGAYGDRVFSEILSPRLETLHGMHVETENVLPELLLATATSSLRA